jgi:hypothetical protein
MFYGEVVFGKWFKIFVVMEKNSRFLVNGLLNIMKYFKEILLSWRK